MKTCATSVCGTRGYTFSIGRSGYDGISVSGAGPNVAVGVTSSRFTPWMIRGASSRPASSAFPFARSCSSRRYALCICVLGAASEPYTEQVGETEVLPRRARLVVQRGLVRRHEPAAAFDECAKLRALRVGERDDVGEHERLERREMLLVEQPVVHHLERDARLDERVIEAVGRVVHERARAPRRRTSDDCCEYTSPTRASERSLRRYVSFAAHQS